MLGVEDSRRYLRLSQAPYGYFIFNAKADGAKVLFQSGFG
jgi:hypothetical protein